MLNQWTYHARLYAAAKYCCSQPDMDLVQLVSFGCGVDAITTDETREILREGGKLYTQLKIDEITNLGAVRIRLRSCLRRWRDRRRPDMEQTYPRFTPDMKKTHKILIPNMAPVQFRILAASMENHGYQVELLGNCGERVAELGLKYVHNDTCYPALLVIGQFLDALDSGKYDLDHTALIITQTGGGCRASNYISCCGRLWKRRATAISPC